MSDIVKSSKEFLKNIDLKTLLFQELYWFSTSFSLIDFLLWSFYVCENFSNATFQALWEIIWSKQAPTGL